MTEWPWRRYHAYAIVLVFGGTGTYREPGGYRRDIVPGDAILVRPQAPHWYGPSAGKRWSEMYVVFDGPVFDLLFASSLRGTDVPVRPLQPLGRWMSQIAAAVSRPVPARAEEAATELLQFAALLVRLLDGASSWPPTDDLDDPIGHARRLLSEDVLGRRSLPDIARNVGLTYETFRHRFAEAVGLPPGRYRDLRRMDVATDLLGLSDVLCEVGVTDSALGAGKGHPCPHRNPRIR